MAYSFKGVQLFHAIAEIFVPGGIFMLFWVQILRDTTQTHKHHTCMSQCHTCIQCMVVNQLHEDYNIMRCTTHKICDQGGEGGEHTSSGRKGRSDT